MLCNMHQVELLLTGEEGGVRAQLDTERDNYIINIDL